MTLERRRHLRVVTPGAYCELIVAGATIGVVHVEDVSDSGVFVAVPRPLVPAQTKVELRFIEEAEPLVVAGVIVQVVPPGSGRTPGYGIELSNPPINTVERVIATRIDAPTRRPPEVAPPPPTTTTTTTAILIGTAHGPSAPMAQALSAFGVEASFFVDPKAALKSLDKNTRIVLAELPLLDATSATIAQIRAAAARARIIVTVDALPAIERRAQLLKQGADELLLAPFDVF